LRPCVRVHPLETHGVAEGFACVLHCASSSNGCHVLCREKQPKEKKCHEVARRNALGMRSHGEAARLRLCASACLLQCQKKPVLVWLRRCYVCGQYPPLNSLYSLSNVNSLDRASLRSMLRLWPIKRCVLWLPRPPGPLPTQKRFIFQSSLIP